jgi:hypothetical protein
VGFYRSRRREATCSRESRFSFLSMFVTWWCTVCSERKSSPAKQGHQAESTAFFTLLGTPSPSLVASTGPACVS